MKNRSSVAITGQRPRWLTGLGLVSLGLFLVGIFLALVVSPQDAQQGDLIRIMYAHVAVAWVMFLAIILAGIFGALYLWRGRKLDDIVAVSSAEMALFYAGLTLIGGMTYSRPTLNTWWAWDAKLTLTALMFFLLVGYFVVRALIDDPERRGRVSAVIGLIVTASVPFNYMAAVWFRTLHPARSIRLDGGESTMGAPFLRILLFNAVAAALVYLYFTLERVRLGRLEAGLDELDEQREDDPSLVGEVVRV